MQVFLVRPDTPSTVPSASKLVTRPTHQQEGCCCKDRCHRGGGKKSNHLQRIIAERKQSKDAVLSFAMCDSVPISDAKIDPLLERLEIIGVAYSSS